MDVTIHVRPDGVIEGLYLYRIEVASGAWLRGVLETRKEIDEARSQGSTRDGFQTS